MSINHHVPLRLWRRGLATRPAVRSKMALARSLASHSVLNDAHCVLMARNRPVLDALCSINSKPLQARALRARHRFSFPLSESPARPRVVRGVMPETTGRTLSTP